MHESEHVIEGIQTNLVVSNPDDHHKEAVDSSIQANIVLLHGYSMTAQDLVPFAHSLRLRARFFVPQAPLAVAKGGYSWWSIDESQRMLTIAQGARDLVAFEPTDRALARQGLINFCARVRATWPARSLLLCGFSQGGMLASDALLCGGLDINGLAMLSSSRIAFDDWQEHRERVRNLPIFVAHGKHDADLAFSAGEGLRDFYSANGAQVTWLPFEGAHEIPLVVWRNLRVFLKQFGV